MQAVGYAFNYLDGKITLEKAVESIKITTRQYAKRQLTWFRKDKKLKWFLPSQLKTIIEFVETEIFQKKNIF